MRGQASHLLPGVWKVETSGQAIKTAVAIMPVGEDFKGNGLGDQVTTGHAGGPDLDQVLSRAQVIRIHHGPQFKLAGFDCQQLASIITGRREEVHAVNRLDRVANFSGDSDIAFHHQGDSHRLADSEFARGLTRRVGKLNRAEPYLLIAGLARGHAKIAISSKVIRAAFQVRTNQSMWLPDI